LINAAGAPAARIYSSITTADYTGFAATDEADDCPGIPVSPAFNGNIQRLTEARCGIAGKPGKPPATAPSMSSPCMLSGMTKSKMHWLRGILDVVCLQGS
jgi:hypothetical protein